MKNPIRARDVATMNRFSSAEINEMGYGTIRKEIRVMP